MTISLKRQRSIPRELRSTVLLVTAAALLLAHFALGGEAMDARGPVLVLDHLFDLAAVLALLTLCFATGRALLGRLGILAALQPLEALIFATTVGASVLATWLLIMGLTVGFGAVTLGATGIVLLWLTRGGIRGVGGQLSDAIHALAPPHGRNQIGWWLAAGVSVALAGLAALALPPPTDWDSLAYHLTVPAEWLRGGRILLPDGNLHTAFAGLVHMLYVPLLAVGSMAGPALLSAAFALLLALATAAFCLRFLSWSTAWLSFALIWANAMILLVAATPRIDVTLTLFLFLAQYALILALEGKGGTRFFLLAGVLLGCATGVKLLALPFALTLGPLVVWSAFRLRAGAPAATAWLLLAFSAGLVAAALPWLVKNQLLLDAPLYPLLAGHRLEPWLAHIYGSTSAPSIPGAASRAFEQFREPFNLFYLFFHPERLTPEAEGVHYRLNPLFLMAPLILAVRPPRQLLHLLLPAVLYVLLMSVAYPFTNLRYFLPIIPALTIVVAYLTDRLSLRLPTGWARRVCLTALVLFLLIPTGSAILEKLRSSETAEFAAGTRSRDDYLASFWETAMYFQTARWANQHVRQDGRVLMLYEARAFYLRPPVLQDTQIHNWVLIQPRATEPGCLQGLGITHVFVNFAVIDHYRRRGMDMDEAGWGTFPAFAARCLEPAFEAPGFMLYRIRSAP